MRSVPVTWSPDPASRSVVPMTWHPNCAIARARLPVTTDPNITSIPVHPITFDPDMGWTGRRADVLTPGRRRLFSHYYFRSRDDYSPFPNDNPFVITSGH